MAMMEQAAGVSALFDADGHTIMANQARLDLHTALASAAADLIEFINQQEIQDASDHTNA